MKLNSLKAALLNSSLTFDPDNVLVFADEGQVTSYPGNDNRHFQMTYQANVIITESTHDAEQIMWLILEWLNKNQPMHGENPISFEVDILNHRTADLALKLEITETICVDVTEEGISLNSCVDPNLNEIYPAELDMDIEHNPRGRLEVN